MLGGEATVGPYMPLKRPLILTFLKIVTLDYSLVSPTHVLASRLPNREKRPSTHPFLPSIEDLYIRNNASFEEYRHLGLDVSCKSVNFNKASTIYTEGILLICRRKCLPAT